MPLQQDSLRITPEAESRVKEVLSKEEEGGALRIYVENGKFVLSLDKKNPKDKAYTFDGFEVIVDPKSLKYVIGLKVDYVQDEEGGAFELTHAMAKEEGCGGHCSCGHD